MNVIELPLKRKEKWNCTYLDLDDKLGSDIFRRLFRWFLLCDKRSLYDSERFTDTGADFDLVLEKTKMYIRVIQCSSMTSLHERLATTENALYLIGDKKGKGAQTRNYLSRFSLTAS